MLKLREVQFAYEADGERFTVTTARSVRTEDAALTISTDGEVFSAAVHAEHAIRILHLNAVFECDLTESDRIFLNGYQSWTDSHEHTIHDRMRGIDRIPAAVANKYAFSQYGDYNFTRYDTRPGHLHGWSYGYLRTGPIYRFIGSLAEDAGLRSCARIRSSRSSSWRRTAVTCT